MINPNNETPKIIVKPDIDTIIGDFYDVCDTYWVFKINGDQWWTITAQCEHNKYFQFTSEIATLTETILDLYKQVEKDHEDLKNDN